MQVVIVGAGNVGYTLARTMSRKYTVMMVEQDEKRYRRIGQPERGAVRQRRRRSSGPADRRQVVLAVTEG